MLDIPEIAGLDSHVGSVRIPPEADVPFTARVRAVVDTPQFRRLSGVSQLGLVALVFPAATHTRFEHSLGVFRTALLFLKQMAREERFLQAVDREQAERFLLAALLHDLGHWPFCHPIEDLDLPGVTEHEVFSQRFLLESPLADVLRDVWKIDPMSVWTLLSEPPKTTADRILRSLLSGPIDIDKLDYLNRDSLHAGVPYGRHFDQGRLIGSLCLNQSGDGLAITEKGKTAAELMVFARYVMFSEVYWHHGVRSATAMLQRAMYLLHDRMDLCRLFLLTDAPFIASVREAAESPMGDPAAAELWDGLFGPTRRLYKRLAQYSIVEQPDVYRRMAQRPYPWLACCSQDLAARLSRRTGLPIAPHHVLFDAPPVHREVELNVDVRFLKDGSYRRLEEISPVMRALAREQFDDYVKRVRVFVHPAFAPRLRSLSDFPDLLSASIAVADQG